MATEIIKEINLYNSKYHLKIGILFFLFLIFILFLYKNINDTWTQVGSDIYGEGSGNLSGCSISLSSDGSIVAIGAVGNDGNGINSGHVRVFSTNNKNPNITGPSGSAGDATSSKSINENTRPSLFFISK